MANTLDPGHGNPVDEAELAYDSKKVALTTNPCKAG